MTLDNILLLLATVPSWRIMACPPRLVALTTADEGGNKRNKFANEERE